MSGVFLSDGAFPVLTVWVPPSRAPKGITEVRARDIAPDFPGTIDFVLCEEVPLVVRAVIRKGFTFVAHNAEGFDALAWERFAEEQPSWYDTVHACRSAGIPASLDAASKFLGAAGKDEAGRKAMHLLCHKRPGSPYPVGTVELWKLLLRYNVGDVLELRRIYLATLGSIDPIALTLHQKINERGMPIDRSFARTLKNLWGELGDSARDEVAELTGGAIRERDMNSPAKVKAWLAGIGYPLDSLDRKRVEAMLADPEGYFPEDSPAAALAVAVIRARAQSVRATPGKIDRVFAAADADDRVRGCFVYHGAHTGRWSARDLQPHNFPRGVECDIAGLIAEPTLPRIRSAGPPGDVLGTLTRPIICAPEGRRLVICDFATVEARMVAWLTRDDTMLAAFGDTSRDIYREMAAVVYGVPLPTVTKDQRWLGKQVVLGCGYGMGAGKFEGNCRVLGKSVTPELSKQAVSAFRRTYASVPAGWKALGSAFRRVVEEGGSDTACRCQFTKVGSSVRLTLPSGRAIHYHDCRMEDLPPAYNPALRVPTITYRSAHGVRKSTWGGTIMENVSQAACRDLMVHSMRRLDAAGWEVVLHVHDELVVECEEAAAPSALRDMLDAMSVPPAWAAGFPMRCEGFMGERYTKGALKGFQTGEGFNGVVTVG